MIDILKARKARIERTIAELEEENLDPSFYRRALEEIDDQIFELEETAIPECNLG